MTSNVRLQTLDVAQVIKLRQASKYLNIKSVGWGNRYENGGAS